MRYEWDQRKNRENRRKHDGFSFGLATLVFDDEHRMLVKDHVDQTGEQRWHTIGTASLGPGAGDIFTVVHVYREGEDGEDVIRIISARRASPDEYRRYQEQEMD
jgi:uncharacterized DUF497 family protein